MAREIITQFLAIQGDVDQHSGKDDS